MGLSGWIKRGSFTGKLFFGLLFLVSIFVSGPADSAGLLIADGGFGGQLEIREHRVHTVINNGVAVTTVEQVFKNLEDRQVEALYTFPVPKRASVSNFSMWINGREMVGEVLEKDRAREIYNSYKQKRRDPGLLEQVDYKTFEMRIFPINAGAEQRVQISYYQEMDVDHDEATFVYPLATVTRPDIDSRTTGVFSMTVEVKSVVPLVDINSPSHVQDFIFNQPSERYALASLEVKEGSLASDVVINYSIERPRTGLDLVTSRGSDEDGYFCLSLTAGKELEKLDEGMDYVFLLDISGSMRDDRKLVISQKSAAAFINELGPEDRFEVMTFNVSPNVLFGHLEPSEKEAMGKAASFLSTRSAGGGTILASAMNTAYAYKASDRLLNVVILSDGMTEQGERQELMELIRSRPMNVRVFCIGIGNEVNRPLLEQMADDSGGLAAFISKGENFERQARAFRRKLVRPVATDVLLKIDGITVYDVEPAELPNLYHGSPIRIYGRYTGPGEATVTLNATVQGKELEQTASLLFPIRDIDNPEIERMWAWKRVDQLLKKADKGGSRVEVISDIVALGEKYSIVTEYTSFLVLENDAEYKRWKIERRNEKRLSRDREAQARRQEVLHKIREKAIADLGPQKTASEEILARASKDRTNVQQPVPSSQSQPAPGKSRQSHDFDFGSGPVGPLFVGIAFWLRRRKGRQVSSPENHADGGMIR